MELTTSKSMTFFTLCSSLLLLTMASDLLPSAASTYIRELSTVSIAFTKVVLPLPLPSSSDWSLENRFLWESGALMTIPAVTVSQRPSWMKTQMVNQISVREEGIAYLLFPLPQSVQQEYQQRRHSKSWPSHRDDSRRGGYHTLDARWHRRRTTSH